MGRQGWVDLTVAVQGTYDFYWPKRGSGLGATRNRALLRRHEDQLGRPCGTRPPGDIAQLGERGVRNAEAEGSSPSISTKCPCSSADRAAAS